MLLDSVNIFKHVSDCTCVIFTNMQSSSREMVEGRPLNSWWVLQKNTTREVNVNTTGCAIDARSVVEVGYVNAVEVCEHNRVRSQCKECNGGKH